nr:CHAT domain-containing protein [Bradyrhizobium sp. 146]
MTRDSTTKQREDYGVFFTNILIPEDFRRLTEGSANLTLEVDETTAVYPWEMATSKSFAKASFLSTTVAVSRQFRSVLSPPPTSPPTLNNRLKALIIADPAPDELALPHARNEGAAVVEVLEQARKAWKGRYDITAMVRIGPCNDAAGQVLLEKLQAQNKCVVSAEPCQPLELAMLIVNGQFDLIHYAGHGISQPETGQTGWIFAGDCILSAKDIFRVRQVPRLVFANACFSAATSDHNEQRDHMAGLAQAFFARGIPNFIGAGWKVDDACAEECARWFYARIMGLSSPGATGGLIGTAPPATIGEALKKAREMAYIRKPQSPSWGAYQHYGQVSDKLVAMPNNPAPDDAASQAAASDAVAVKALDTRSTSSTSGVAKMAASDPNAGSQTPDPNLVYVNGIDLDTGKYAFPPRSIGDLAKQVLANPGTDHFSDMHGDKPRSFALPFNMDPNKLQESGWAIIFHTDTPQPIHDALEPLIALRRTQANGLFKELDYRKGEQARDWYARHGISPGNIDPPIVPYYLLLVGPPELIPFEFQYLLGVDYAIGRLSFDTPEGYQRYARSTVAYESARSLNRKEIAYWGTRHLGDAATELSASMLVDPLAKGIAGATGTLKRAVNTEVGYERKLLLGDDATKASLLETLHAKTPPAMLFTASHGMAMRSGQAAQTTNQGALLCQDWPGFGSVDKEHMLAAADVADDANVNGVVALLFACFGAGTPDADQFLMNLSQAGRAPPLAPQPFIAALPQRLLAHPNGSALAVIGHIDRAWGFSIETPKTSGPQIGAFRNSIGSILKGGPVGHAISGFFGAKFASLSVLLLSATSPTAANATRLSDRELVTRWLERNDAQNYVLLGDPAVRIRSDALA